MNNIIDGTKEEHWCTPAAKAQQLMRHIERSIVENLADNLVQGRIATQDQAHMLLNSYAGVIGSYVGARDTLEAF